jgi:hypothetical protein
VSRRLPEQLLWDDLREAMGTLWFARRIEDRLGGGLPDVAFAGKKRRYSWMELKVLPRLPQENRIFDISHFTPEQRAFGLASAQHGGNSSWWLMTRLDGVDHLHRANIIDDLGESKYSVFRNKAAWIGRISPEVAPSVAKILFA